jgi:3-deoxy-manno-octulosonate cytidylyltransferase (CMP-KDO synthetase)
MIRRVYEQALRSTSLSQVVVATDDSRIYDEVVSFGGFAVMTSSDHQNGTGRCAEVLQKLGSEVEVVINIQGDEPFIHQEQIDTLAALFDKSECRIGTLIKECNDKVLLRRPSIIKATVDKDFRALYFSRSVIPFLRDTDTPHTFYKHIGIYGYRAETLKEIVKLKASPLELAESLEQLRWLESGYTIHTAITEHESVSIDVPEDLERVKELL